MSTTAGGVTAEQLVQALKKRRAMLPADMGTFVALEACEELVRRGPCRLSLSDIVISEEGRVVLAASELATEDSCAHALHEALASLLVAAGPAPAPGLMRLVEDGPRGGSWTLTQLRDDLEASLVPLNRNASRRVLARLVREVEKDARPSARPPREPSFRDLDSQLSSFLGVAEPEEPEPAPPRAARERDHTVREPVEHVDPSHDEVLFFEQEIPSAQREPDAPRKVPSAPVSSPAPVAAIPSAQRKAGVSMRPSQRPGNPRGLLVFVLLVGLTLGLVATTFVLRPDVLDRLLGRANETEAAKPPPPPLPPRPRAGDLVVRVSPDRSQVLRFVGRGPAVVKHLPLGVAHEFVAIAEGVTPTRALLPKDAEWERTPDGPRYELAMQLGQKLPNGASPDLGDSLLPADVGTPGSELGSVRIVTTPKGAKVYQVVGFAPEARMENLPLDATQEILVFHKGYTSEIRVIAPSDFASEGARPTAEVRVQLNPSK